MYEGTWFSVIYSDSRFSNLGLQKEPQFTHQIAISFNDSMTYSKAYGVEVVAAVCLRLLKQYLISTNSHSRESCLYESRTAQFTAATGCTSTLHSTSFFYRRKLYFPEAKLELKTDVLFETYRHCVVLVTK